MCLAHSEPPNWRRSAPSEVAKCGVQIGVFCTPDLTEPTRGRADVRNLVNGEHRDADNEIGSGNRSSRSRVRSRASAERVRG